MTLARGLLLVLALALLASCGGGGGGAGGTATPRPTVPAAKFPDHYQEDAGVAFEYGVLDLGGLDLGAPTAIAMGPDGRLYVATQSGGVYALTLDGTRVSDTQTLVEPVRAPEGATVTIGEPPPEYFGYVLGIAFNPLDAPDPATVYVSRTLLYLGADGPPYVGKISKLVPPDYHVQDVITGLPVSPNEHGTNGIAFDAEGRLYIAQGSNTNAGVPAERFPRDDTPLSGAVLVADVSAPGFDGNVTYDPPDAASVTSRIVSGDVRVFAPGFRNPYDLVLHSNGKVYALDNGPNLDSGPASETCDSAGAEPYEPDELDLVVEGQYYGSPNRNRGRDDPRQCTYVSGRDSGSATAPIARLGLSIVPAGLLEYTSGAFGGTLRGDLIYVEWGDPRRVMRVELSDDGTRVVSIAPIAEGPLGRPLDATLGPDGTIYLAEWESLQIGYLRPAE